MIEPNDHLSPQGQARRDAMLGDLTAAMTTLRRRRRARRLTVSAATTALLCFAFFRASQVPTADTRRVTIPRPSFGTVAVRTVHVQTEEGIAVRLRASPPTLVTRINDAQLLHTLVEIGRPAGLIRFGDRIAVSAPVTDEERSPPN